MKSSSFGARTLGSRISSSSPKSILGIGLWAFWRCCFVYLLMSRISSGLWSGSGVGREDLWVMGIGMLVCLGDFEKTQGCEVQPHSPRGQLGLPGKVKAGVRGMIVAVRFYSDLGFYGRLPAPCSGVWMKEWGSGHGCSGQRAGEGVWGKGVWVEDGKNIVGVLVSYEDLCLF